MQDDSVLVCQKCGSRNSPDAGQCGNCGKRIDGVCASCGYKNPPEVKYYCYWCGESLIGSKSETKPESSAAEPGYGQASVEAETETTPGSADSGSKPEPAISVGVCPRCQHSNEPDSSYCYHCGLPLDDEKILGTSLTGDAYKQGAPAGFWVRFIAFFLDAIFMNIMYLVIYWIFGEDITRVLDAEPPFVFADLVNFVGALIYAPLFISLWGTTVGKKLFEVHVVKVDGGRCGFWRAFGRELAKILSAVLLCIGFLMVAFRSDKRGLHDLIAGTAVIKR